MICMQVFEICNENDKIIATGVIFADQTIIVQYKTLSFSTIRKLEKREYENWVDFKKAFKQLKILNLHKKIQNFDDFKEKITYRSMTITLDCFSLEKPIAEIFLL